MLKLNVEDCKVTLKETEFPKVIIIETASVCNLRCIMCPQEKIKRKGSFIEEKLYNKIINEIAEVSKETEVWFAIMGEPLIRGKEFIDMIEYASSKGLTNLNLNTNAMCLNKDLADALLKSGLSKITIGIDAACASTYEKIRRNGDYDQVVENVTYLSEQIKKENSKLEIITQFIVMDENEEEEEQFKQFWLSKKITVKIRPKLGWGGESGISTENLYLDKKDRNFPCPWLIRTMSIHVDGNIAQCDADWDDKYNLANLNNRSIKDIWNSELKEIRTKHWKLNFESKPCCDCKDWQAGRSYFYYAEKEELV